MPVLKANFSQISSSFEPLPADVEFLVTIEKVEAGETKENHLPQITFTLEVSEPAEYAGRKILDFVTLMTNKGEINKIGYGRVKAYTEAVLGDEAAGGEEIDTDALVSGACRVILKPDTYADKSGKQVTNTKVAKVLPQ